MTGTLQGMVALVTGARLQFDVIILLMRMFRLSLIKSNKNKGN